MSTEQGGLAQITSRSGQARTPSSTYEPPSLIELNLEPNQRVIQVEWSRGFDHRTRKTVDWTWTVWIETRRLS
jgi:hypothetical protein